MDLATLKGFRPTEYEEAADGYRTTGDMAGAAKDTINNRISAGMTGRLRARPRRPLCGSCGAWRRTFTTRRPSAAW